MLCTALQDLGYSNFNCDITPGNPKNVHEVRPADLKIVAALGDSLSVGSEAVIETQNFGSRFAQNSLDAILAEVSISTGSNV